MPGIYTVNFTDGTKTPITIPPLVINNSTSLTMVGYRTPVYGEAIWENFLHLLEHFSRDSSPSNPIQGQIWAKKVAAGDEIYVFDPRHVTNTTHANWHATDTAGILSQSAPPSDTRVLWYDTNRKTLRYWDGALWDAITPISSTTSPSSPYPGQLWHDTNTNALRYWDGALWLNITTLSSTTAPTSPYLGQVWHDTTPGYPCLRYWNGAGWISLTNMFNNVPPTAPYRGQIWVNSTFTPGIPYFYDSSFVSNTTYPNWHLLSTGIDQSTTAPPSTNGLWFNPTDKTLRYWDGTTWANTMCFWVVRACDYNEIVGALNTYLVTNGQPTVSTVVDPVSDAQWTTLLNKIRDIAVAEGVGIPTSEFAFTSSKYCGATDTCGFLTVVAPFDAAWDTLLVVNTVHPPAHLLPATQTITGTSGIAIAPTAPLVGTEFGGTIAYTISPALPTGLTLNSTTGVISGATTITTPGGVLSYTITGTGSAYGVATTSVSLEMATPVASLSPLGQLRVIVVGSAITPTVPLIATNFVGTVTYTMHPSTPTLPAGLVLNSATGVISGTPTVSVPIDNYAIRGTGSIAGSATTTVSIGT